MSKTIAQKIVMVWGPKKAAPLTKLPAAEFSRHRTYHEIKGQCKAQGVYFNDRFFKQGGDTVLVGGDIGSVGAWAIYNVCNGHFFGRTPIMQKSLGYPDAVKFSSCDNRHDDCPWFQDLLNFFLVK